MLRVVKCPICGRIRKTYAKWFFRCCGRAFEVNKCLTDFNEKIFRSEKNGRKTEEYRRIKERNRAIREEIKAIERD